MQMLALSTANIRWRESYCFYPLLPLILVKSTFCSNYSRTSLLHSVSVFPENLNTNVIPCLLQLKPKAFLWMYNRSVQFIFQLTPNLLDGVEVRTLNGPVQQIPSIAGSYGYSSFYGYYNDHFNKNNWNLLNMSNVLLFLATTVCLGMRI